LRSLKDIPGLDRIRLSSLEPDDLSDDLMETMQGIPQLGQAPSPAAAERLRRHP